MRSCPRSHNASGMGVLSRVTQYIRLEWGMNPTFFISSDVFCLLSKIIKKGRGNMIEDQEHGI